MASCEGTHFDCEENQEPRPDRRQRILDAAYDLFCANGINQVGIDTILARVGLCQGQPLRQLRF